MTQWRSEADRRLSRREEMCACGRWDSTRFPLETDTSTTCAAGGRRPRRERSAPSPETPWPCRIARRATCDRRSQSATGPRWAVSACRRRSVGSIASRVQRTTPSGVGSPEHTPSVNGEVANFGFWSARPVRKQLSRRCAIQRPARSEETHVDQASGPSGRQDEAGKITPGRRFREESLTGWRRARTSEGVPHGRRPGSRESARRRAFARRMPPSRLRGSRANRRRTPTGSDRSPTFHARRASAGNARPAAAADRACPVSG